MACSCNAVEKYAVTLSSGTVKIVKTQVERDALVAKGATYKVIPR